MGFHADTDHQQDAGAHHQQAADDVEQSGAHAAGLGEGGAPVVLYGDIDNAGVQIAILGSTIIHGDGQSFKSIRSDSTIPVLPVGSGGGDD